MTKGANGLVFLAGSLLLASAVLAQGTPLTAAQNTSPTENYGRPGPYVGVGFAYGLEDFDLGNLQNGANGLPGGGAVSLSADDSPGFDIRAGYRAHPNFAVEGQFQYFTGFDLNAKANYSGAEAKVATLDALTFTVNAKVYPLTGQFQPYGLLGIGMLRGNVDVTNTDISRSDVVFATRIGVGMDFYATHHWVVNGEFCYLRASNDYDFDGGKVGGSLMPFVVGMQYRF
jgi:opacity protein-like surface antigen